MSKEPENLIIQTSPASEEQKAWHAYLRKSREEEPARLEEAAKFLAAILSITFTILFSTQVDSTKNGWIALAAMCWILALLLAFLVLFPRPYQTVKESAEAIENMHHRSVKWKTYFLAGAALLFVVGVLMLGLVFWMSITTTSVVYSP